MTKKQVAKLDAWIFEKFKIENATFERSRALTLFERLLNEYNGDICFFKSRDNPGYYRIFRMTDFDINVGENKWWVEAKTLPLAICLFAQKII